MRYKTEDQTTMSPQTMSQTKPVSTHYESWYSRIRIKRESKLLDDNNLFQAQLRIDCESDTKAVRP